MKKFLLVLALAGCVLGMTACGSTEDDSGGLSYTQEAIEDNTAKVFTALDMLVEDDAVEEGADQLEAVKSGTGEILIADGAIWESALTEIGSYEGIVEDSVSAEGTDEAFTVYCEIKGSQRNAQVELYYTKEFATVTIFPGSMMISPNYTLGEKMEKAALNTLLGMGTVFIVLILIMLIIMAFGIIPKIEKSIADKKAKKNVSTDAAVDNTIAQIVEKEELSDDTELVAVIAAAIAAYEGAATTDGFVVRSIKRANTNKWQRA